VTALLARLLGRMPVGWLQLTHNKGRLASALAGVAFANVLVFVQIGIMGSLNQTTREAYGFLNADIMISAEDANTLTEGSNVARQWMLTALADPGITQGAALYVGNLQWKQAGHDTTLQVMAIDTARMSFLTPRIARKSEVLLLPDVAILDLKTRGMDPDQLAGIRPHSPLQVEVTGRTLNFANTFEGGVGFAADGYVIASAQTFLRLFPKRQPGAGRRLW